MNKGKLTIYYGPMFAGKSLRLIKDINNNSEKKLVFKPKQDTRTEGKIKSRDGLEFESITIKDSEEIFNYLISNNENKVRTIYIDEINFFGDDLFGVVKKILKKKINVVLSGLDKDYRTEYFPQVKLLIEIADEKFKLTARCFVCNEPSEFTSRYINGKPDSRESETLICDSKLSKVEYKTLCKKHHPLILEDEERK